MDTPTPDGLGDRVYRYMAEGKCRRTDVSHGRNFSSSRSISSIMVLGLMCAQGMTQVLRDAID